MDELSALTSLSEEDRDQALKRFHLIQPFLEGQMTLSAVAEESGIPLRTAQRWVNRYQQYGLAGLTRKRRRDRGHRRLPSELQKLIEGLALQKSRPTAAAIHRQVAEVAEKHGWKVPSYSSVNNIVRALAPPLVTLAHKGTKAYQESYDLLFRREADKPNEIWQADHTPLDRGLFNKPIRLS